MKEIIKKGDKHSKLTAIKFSHKDKHNKQHWLFKCDCGKEKIICVSDVKRRNTKSCGCLDIERRIKHGMYETRTYRAWTGMKQRCLNKKFKHYKNWGGRGIKVCKRWMKFENFYKDMGNCPRGKSLDRKNNDKGYYKKNCRWATMEEQLNNTRRNCFLTYSGRTQTIAQWARELNVSSKTLRGRIKKYHWELEKALTSKKYTKRGIIIK